MPKSAKAKRPKIPPNVQLKLWVNSAGFCEFPGCTRFLLEDGLTLKEANYSNIAHIISWTPTGPRGDEKLSPILAAEYLNLMLMCQDHADQIDKFEKDYPVDILKTWKKNHEDKVKLLLGKYGEEKTSHLVAMSKIGDQSTSISFDEIREATAPRYPENKNGTFIDLTDFSPDRLPEIGVFTQKITDSVSSLLSKGTVDGIPKHISVFALAPIPLLVHLGTCLGNKIPAELYQKHSNQKWAWPNSQTKKAPIYSIGLSEDTSKKVALILSLSGKIDPSELGDAEYSIYEISVDNPNRNFLDSPDKLNKYREVYREVLAVIRKNHGSDCEVHVFPAIPAPIAIAMGQEIIPKSDPSILIYDHDKTNGGFKQIIKVN